MRSDFTRCIKSISYAITLAIFLQGCQLNQVAPAPVEKIESKPKMSTEPIVTTNQSYPLPPPPVIDNNISISVEPVPSSATGVPLAQVQPSSEGQAILDQIIAAPNVVIPPTNAGSTPIAANSPVAISTPNQTINYTAPAGSPNWQSMSAKAFESLNSSSAISEPVFVNSINNQTNGSLPIFALDQIIQQNAYSKMSVQIADTQSVNLAKQQLGVSANDTLINRSKAIAIAKALNLKYVIYPSISGDATSPVLSLQLIDATSAEILAEGESKAIF